VSPAELFDVGLELVLLDHGNKDLLEKFLVELTLLVEDDLHVRSLWREVEVHDAPVEVLVDVDSPVVVHRADHHVISREMSVAQVVRADISRTKQKNGGEQPDRDLFVQAGQVAFEVRTTHLRLEILDLVVELH
jgi:hypothetical protein